MARSAEGQRRLGDLRRGCELWDSDVLQGAKCEQGYMFLGILPLKILGRLAVFCDFEHLSHVDYSGPVWIWKRASLELGTCWPGPPLASNLLSL